MGKKKSVVLMTLITIVTLVLLAIVAFPKVSIPGTGGIKKWNPAVMQYDLGTEFSGGHYAYYYPNGVITESDYNALDDEDKATYTQVGNLYMSNDEDDCILENGQVSEGFKTAFNKSVDILSARFAARAANTGSTYRVAVVDDYAIRVDLSASENSKNQTSLGYAQQVFTQYAYMGAITFAIGDDLVDQLDEKVTENPSIHKVVKSVSVKTQYEVAYLKITFTKEGKEMLKTYKSTASSSSGDGSSEATYLNLKIGDETLLQITSESITDKNEVMYGVQYEEEKLSADTLCVLINSAMDNGGVYVNDNEATPFELKAPTNVEIRTYEPVYGNTLVWVYVAILVLLLAACVLAIVKMGGFGVMNAYVSVTYLLIAAFCFAFISGGVFVVSLESVFVFLAGLALVNVFNGYIYSAIKDEVALGKTVQSSVKGGYKKTLWTVVDVYAVLLLGAVALLLGVASLNTVACQAIICILAGAFCTLLWGRVINTMLLSISKDKYKYFRLVREDDEDDE